MEIENSVDTWIEMIKDATNKQIPVKANIVEQKAISNQQIKGLQWREIIIQKRRNKQKSTNLSLNITPQAPK